MRSERDCGKMRILVIACAVVSVVWLCLLGMMRLDKEHGMELSWKAWMLLGTGSVIAVYIWTLNADNSSWSVRIAWLVIHIYFLCCSVTDYLTCQVYDIFQYAGMGAAAYLVLSQADGVAVGFSILLFGLLQYAVFMKLYGEADGMAFLAAALAEGARGYDITGYLFHMILAYLLLSLVQGLKGNIGRRGRLKRAVPFLPYITAGFWVMLVYAEEIQGCL